MSKKTKAKQATKQQYQEINKLIEELKKVNNQKSENPRSDELEKEDISTESKVLLWIYFNFVKTGKIGQLTNDLSNNNLHTIAKINPNKVYDTDLMLQKFKHLSQNFTDSKSGNFDYLSQNLHKLKDIIKDDKINQIACAESISENVSYLLQNLNKENSLFKMLSLKGTYNVTLKKADLEQYNPCNAKIPYMLKNAKNKIMQSFNKKETEAILKFELQDN